MRNFFLFIFFLFSFNLLAKNDSVFVISKLTDSSEVFLLNKFWKFHTGDDIKWALSEANDSSWQNTKTEFSTADTSTIKFNGIGWFRLHFFIPKGLEHKPLALLINQQGASEFYLDGKLIQSFGKPAAEKIKETKFTPNGKPFIIEFDSIGKHVFAVRYSNQNVQQMRKKYLEKDFGFTVALKAANPAVEDALDESLTLSVLLIFLFTFFITLSFIHFLLFLFYRAQKSNLYYSIFIFLFGVFFLLPVLLTNISNPDSQSILTYYIFFLLPAFFTSLLGFIYSLFYIKIPKLFWIISGILGVILILKFLNIEPGIVSFSYICMVTIISAVEVFKAIFKKKKGAWAIGIAAISFLILVITLLLKNALGLGNNLSINGDSPVGIILFGLLVTSLLGIPFSMSFYLARDFAKTSKTLSKKLIEVEDLSAKTIEQEKEKQKILESQKEILEVQVQERTAEIVEQKHLIEEKNKDITDSIYYAKTIQEAILPAKEIKYRIFPDAFVLFKPKDIVSGDFYWFTEKNGKKIIAACDCTGHGVPGALMSMIGNNILNQIVNERGITAPDEILNILHKEIHKALKQEDEKNAKDGMDIALVTFNSETEIEFAGAQRPLWIVKSVNEKGDIAQTQNNNSSLVLDGIKGDKFSIGGSQAEEDRKFTNHKLSLTKGSRLYIFSDGYADQFSGSNKKLMTKKFKEILLSIQGKEMPDQEKFLDNFIENWKGNFEQTDDILVIGITI
jgi:serine phosphatase RsbU (regulator of sigma subunit)